jgi:hypothetical protein
MRKPAPYLLLAPFIMGVLLGILLTFSAALRAQTPPWDDTNEQSWEKEWEDEWVEEAWSDEPQSPWQPLTGFIETAVGTRLDRDPLQQQRETLTEVRIRLENGYRGAVVETDLKLDLHYDRIEAGWGADLRELALQTSPTPSTDLKIGTQVLTWGTGDYLFLNDLFPKDWSSFFSGRHDDYLKAPLTALKLSHYGGDRSLLGSGVNLDLVWIPRFESDRFLTGERFSFFSPGAGALVAPDPGLSVEEPERPTWAARLYFNRGRSEWAFYGYRGYTPQPLALDAGGQPAFSGLDVLGASLLRPLGPGLFNSELAYHHSRDDRSGTDPDTPNSQWRFLLGYQQEVATRLTLSGQYYLERTRHHDRLLAASPDPQFEPERNRHLLTLRLNYRMNQDRVTLGLFGFYSPSDRDYYLRPTLDYRIDDRWSLSGGANLFGGRARHTPFGQLEDASNLYLRVRLHY